MDGLLKPKLRTQLESLVKKGVPPITAGLVYGIRQPTMTRWIRLGMQESAPTKPEYPDRVVEVTSTWKTTEGLYYAHELECRKLADCICKAEGALVAKLTSTLWKASTGKFVDLATSRFMFRQYTHAHGIAEPTKGDKAEDSDDGAGEADAVQVLLPDNGRGPK